MMTRRRSLAAAGLWLAASLLATAAPAQERLPVVATFSILGDMVARVGGDRVAVTTLVGPGGDAHVFQPSPAEARAVAEARLIVANGLGFEGWMERLIAASGATAPMVIATEGVEAITADAEDHADHAADEHADHDHDHAAGEHADHDHDHSAAGDHAGHDHGPLDPHAWQSVPNAQLYVAAIAEGLSGVDPEGAPIYAANAEAYLAELSALDAEIREGLASLPPERRTIVTSHDAFGYFGATYGLRLIAPQGLSTEAEPSARDVAALITLIREQSIGAVFLENIADPRLLDQIAAETGARAGGTLFSDALSGPDGPAPTYVAMMRHNLSQIVAALAP